MPSVCAKIRSESTDYSNFLEELYPNGLITVDAKLSGSINNHNGHMHISGSSAISFGDSFGERLYGETQHYDDPLSDYAFIYYSGHGDRNGDLRIDKNIVITPEELFNISVRTKVPYLIIIDMCYSATFGKRYAELLEEYNWHGVVLCSNDNSSAGGLAFEYEELGYIRRPYWSLNILETNWARGRVVFTTAFTYAFLKLRELDITTNSIVRISISDFNDFLLRPICECLSKDYNLPLQKPSLYSNTQPKNEFEIRPKYALGFANILAEYHANKETLGLLANQGDLAAQCNWAVLLESIGDHKEAFDWYLKAGQRGYPPAQFSLGVHLQMGIGAKKSFKDAILWYSQSADQGYADAMYNLAFMYSNGLGCVNQKNEAFHLYKEAANKNDADSQYSLALLLLDSTFQKKIGIDYRSKGWTLCLRTMMELIAFYCPLHQKARNKV